LKAHRATVSADTHVITALGGALVKLRQAALRAVGVVSAAEPNVLLDAHTRNAVCARFLDQVCCRRAHAGS
jgi:hypothetical protein